MCLCHQQHPKEGTSSVGGREDKRGRERREGGREDKSERERDVRRGGEMQKRWSKVVREGGRDGEGEGMHGRKIGEVIE